MSFPSMGARKRRSGLQVARSVLRYSNSAEICARTACATFRESAKAPVCRRRFRVAAQSESAPQNQSSSAADAESAFPKPHHQRRNEIAPAQERKKSAPFQKLPSETPCQYVVCIDQNPIAFIGAHRTKRNDVVAVLGREPYKTKPLFPQKLIRLSFAAHRFATTTGENQDVLLPAHQLRTDFRITQHHSV